MGTPIDRCAKALQKIWEVREVGNMQAFGKAAPGVNDKTGELQSFAGASNFLVSENSELEEKKVTGRDVWFITDSDRRDIIGRRACAKSKSRQESKKLLGLNNG